MDRAPQLDRRIEAFLTDPEISVVVCSLTAAGVGLNLQVASNVVLAELSWTSAEQTQAIDRVQFDAMEAAAQRGEVARETLLVKEARA